MPQKDEPISMSIHRTKAKTNSAKKIIPVRQFTFASIDNLD